MNNTVKWHLREIDKNAVRLEIDQLSKLPTVEDYKEYISNLLGISELDNCHRLKDESFSPYIGENLLLSRELESTSKRYKRVIFAGPNGDVIVDINNFRQIFKNLISPKTNLKPSGYIKKENIESVQAAVEELWTRG